MDSHVRIAVVGPGTEPLQEALRALPRQPDVRAFASLYGDAEALQRYQPNVLCLAGPGDPAEDLGALRLLRQLWPNLAVLLAVDAARELVVAERARRIGAQLVVLPAEPGALAAALEQALLGSDRPRPDVFVDLARGVADEINNPLLFTAGHLQLLRATFDPQRERDRRDQVDAALQGLQRVQASVDRLRQLSAAAAGPRRREPVDLGALLRDVLAARPASAEPAAVFTIAPGPCHVPGDPEQLAAALHALRDFADELRGLDAAVAVELAPVAGAVRLRLVAHGAALEAWRVPHSFEPYYPHRLLRGRAHGLHLFLVQTVVLAHRGQATARRLADGGLQVEFALPA